MLLAMPDPTDRMTARRTGWKSARYKPARDELAAGELPFEATRTRAGRSLFLPGGWARAKTPGFDAVSFRRQLGGPAAGRRRDGGRRVLGQREPGHRPVHRHPLARAASLGGTAPVSEAAGPGDQGEDAEAHADRDLRADRVLGSTRPSPIWSTRTRTWTSRRRGATGPPWPLTAPTWTPTSTTASPRRPFGTGSREASPTATSRIPASRCSRASSRAECGRPSTSSRACSRTPPRSSPPPCTPTPRVRRCLSSPWRTSWAST